MTYLALLIAFLFGVLVTDLYRDWLEARLYADEWDRMSKPGLDEQREEWG